MYLLVLGYYDKGNLGDEAYKEIMGQFFPGDILDFILSDKISRLNLNLYDAIIVGGGDLLNDYFNQKIAPALRQFKGPKIAFSIGIPFPHLITAEYLGHFDQVFVRNYEDLRAIQKVVGAHRVHFTPDIALAFKGPSLKLGLSESGPSNSEMASRSSGSVEKRCGIFLVGNLIRYPGIVAELAHLVTKIALTHKIIFYCFNPSEDQPLAQAIQEAALRRLQRTNPPEPSEARIQALLDRARAPARIEINISVTSAADMIDQIGALDFGVCLRYHAHVFCAVANLPFISISSTRKTRSFMTQAGLQAYQYQIPLDGYFNPTAINYKELREVCRLGLKSRRALRSQLQVFMCQSRFLLANLQAARILRYQKFEIRTQVAEFLTGTADYQNAARLLSAYVLGYPDSPYVWGITQKLAASNRSPMDVVHESVKYLLRQGATQSRPYSEDGDSLTPSGSLPFEVDLREYQSYREAHRGGWYLACEAMAERNTFGGMICDLYLDRTFHWARNYFRHAGIIPYTGPWCGVIHHTQDTTYNNHNAVTLFEVPEFIQSLHTCRALLCLSSHLGSYLVGRLAGIASHIRVLVLDHPILTPPRLFSMTAFQQNPAPMLIQVGAWMRNPFTLYRIPKLPIQKAILIGKEMNELLPPANFKISGPWQESRIQEPRHRSRASPIVTLPCRSPESIPRWIKMAWAWLESTGVKVQTYQDGTLYLSETTHVATLNATFDTWIAGVKIIPYQPDSAYDQLLSQNIIFLDLVEAAAVNTVIEAIVRQTPILINDRPGTRALLGDDYPLYYNNLDQISSLLAPARLQAGVAYLAGMDRSKYELQTFLDRIGALGSELDSLIFLR